MDTQSAAGAPLDRPAPAAHTVAWLRTERVRLVERLAVVDQALAALDELFGPVPTAGSELPGSRSQRPRRRPAKRPPTEAHICEVCGQGFNRPNGLSRHLNQTHGIRRRAVMSPSEPVDDLSMVLRCSQCGWTAPLGDEAVDELTIHCRAEHSRSPHDRERRPRAPRHFPTVLGNGQHEPSAATMGERRESPEA